MERQSSLHRISGGRPSLSASLSRAQSAGFERVEIPRRCQRFDECRGGPGVEAALDHEGGVQEDDRGLRTAGVLR